MHVRGILNSNTAIFLFIISLWNLKLIPLYVHTVLFGIHRYSMYTHRQGIVPADGTEFYPQVTLFGVVLLYIVYVYFLL